MGRFRGVELDNLQLRGPRLLLRPWRPEDAEPVRAALQDRAMHRYLALPDPYTEADAAAFTGRTGHEGRPEGTGLGCAVVEMTSWRLVGSAALRLTGDPEIGYWIATDGQGHGYAAEATRILADWGFALGLRRIRLVCDARNVASARTALRAGFRFEGFGREGVLGGGSEGVPELRADVARFARLADDPDDPIPHALPPLPPEGLTDEVLRLRTLHPADAAGVLETDDELTRRWNFTGLGHTPKQARQLAERAGIQWLVGGPASLAITERTGDAFAGVLTLRHAGPPQVGGVGYVVHPAFRGRGYTTRALRLLMLWAFDVADFARLELGAKPGNVASLRAAASAGFEPDGVRRRRLRNADGTFSDEIRYAAINPRYA